MSPEEYIKEISKNLRLIRNEILSSVQYEHLDKCIQGAFHGVAGLMLNFTNPGITLTPFTKDDWDGWAGAEPISETQDPLTGNIIISDVQIYDKLAKIIVDNNGITINLTNLKDGPDSMFYLWTTFEESMKIVKNLYPVVSQEFLLKLGFFKDQD